MPATVIYCSVTGDKQAEHCSRSLLVYSVMYVHGDTNYDDFVLSQTARQTALHLDMSHIPDDVLCSLMEASLFFYSLNSNDKPRCNHNESH
jgi:hypothetical protein